MHCKHSVAAYLDVQSLIFFNLFLQVLIKNTLGLQAVLWRRVSFTLEEIGVGAINYQLVRQTLLFNYHNFKTTTKKEINICCSL